MGRAPAVNLVDEGANMGMSHAADFEKLERARFDTLGGVDDHDGGIDRRQRAIGVIGKIFVARRVEQVEDAILYSKVTGGDNGNALAVAPGCSSSRSGSGCGPFLAFTTSVWCPAPNSSSFRSSVVYYPRDDRECAALGNGMVSGHEIETLAWRNAGLAA